MDSNTIREQVKTELQTRGWTLHLKQRRARIYAYAARRIGTRTEDRYLAPFDDLLAMLARVAALPNGYLKDARLVPESSVESAPVCRALYDGPIMDRHAPSTTAPGSYDSLGNYWCADCAMQCEVKHNEARLGLPEVYYFPDNPAIHAGAHGEM